MKKNKIKNLIIIIFLFSIFLYMLYININTHRYHDEFVYSFIYGTTDKCKNLIDIFISLKNIYLMHNGRIISTGIMSILLMMPKIISDILNSLFFILLIFIIYKYIDLKKIENNLKSTNKQYSPLHLKYHLLLSQNKNNKILNLLLLFPMLWVTIPEFNGTITWFSGAVNYLWSTVFMLLYLIFYIKYFINNLLFSKKQIIILSLLGLIIGSLHESIGIITTSFLFFIFTYELIKNKKINYCYLFSCFNCFLGFLSIILSPGSKIRLLATTSGNSISFDNSFINCIEMIKITFSSNPILFILIFLFIIYFIYKNKFNKMINNRFFIANMFLIISAILVYLGMMFSPTFAERVTFAPYILFVLSFFGLLNLSISNNKLKYIFKFLFLLYFLLQAIPSIFETTNLVSKYYNEWISRDNFIQSEKAFGKTDIQVLPFSTPLNSKMYGGDISISTSYNHNGSMAMYYGLNSIRLKKNFYIDFTFCNLEEKDNLSTFTLSNLNEFQTESISILPKNVLEKQAPYKKEKHSTVGENITLHYGVNNIENLKLSINSKNDHISLLYIKIYNYENLNYILYPSDIENKIKTFHNLNLNCGKNSINFLNIKEDSYIEFSF